MAEQPHGIQIEHILQYVLPSRLPLAQILHPKASGPQRALSLYIFEKARSCLLFFPAICLPSLISRLL